MHYLHITFAMEMVIAFFATTTIGSRSPSRKENEKLEQANLALAYLMRFLAPSISRYGLTSFPNPNRVPFFTHLHIEVFCVENTNYL